MIWVFGKSEYFCKGGWTRGLVNRDVICPSGSGWVERSETHRVMMLKMSDDGGLRRVALNARNKVMGFAALNPSELPWLEAD